MFSHAYDISLNIVEIVKNLFEAFVLMVRADSVDVCEVQSGYTFWFWYCCFFPDKVIIRAGRITKSGNSVR